MIIVPLPNASCNLQNSSFGKATTKLKIELEDGFDMINRSYCYGLSNFHQIAATITADFIKCGMLKLYPVRIQHIHEIVLRNNDFLQKDGFVFNWRYENKLLYGNDTVIVPTKLYDISTKCPNNSFWLPLAY